MGTIICAAQEDTLGAAVRLLLRTDRGARIDPMNRDGIAFVLRSQCVLLSSLVICVDGISAARHCQSPTAGQAMIGQDAR